ncbi:hypothetical protein Mal15_16560 [Stieleria maiorica]|uniref:Uncharacterized protein n=1 Tax=Stieleria maiorica TaxID=2795974 RepID=A0A5B9MDR1_9BACT|nr:hypothetical protein [Stieleria maiorica]QEF97615.1 hypothetical protein Mal15_16560 [Stieleria maiorica]
MNDTNPQIEEQLDKLASICCEQLKGDSPRTLPEDSTVDDLLRALLMSGYARRSDKTLQVDIEHRVKDLCRDPAMHRGGALSSMTEQLQSKFDELKSWESRQPDDKSPPKAANISSAGNA